ncbi:MAG: serine/threonine-protein kinase [Pseudomonadota bacterium]
MKKAYYKNRAFFKLGNKGSVDYSGLIGGIILYFIIGIIVAHYSVLIAFLILIFGVINLLKETIDVETKIVPVGSESKVTSKVNKLEYNITDKLTRKHFPDRLERGFVTLDPATIFELVSAQSPKAKTIQEDLKDSEMPFRVYGDHITGNRVIVHDKIELSMQEVSNIAASKASAVKTYCFADNIYFNQPESIEEYLANFLDYYGFLYPKHLSEFMLIIKGVGIALSKAEVEELIEKILREAGPLHEPACQKDYYTNLFFRYGNAMIYRLGLMLLYNFRYANGGPEFALYAEYYMKQIDKELDAAFLSGDIAYVTSADDESVLGVEHLRGKGIRKAGVASRETMLSNFPEGTSKLLKSRYLLIREIGRGGMGIVYEALDEKTGNKVAIKKMKEELKISKREKQRFLKEAAIVAKLHHDNIVELYDLIEDADNIYLVFEYIKGITVEDILEKKGKLRYRDALILGLEICKALDYAHGQHIVHRDLKPSNILVNKEKKIKIMDFGIAREAKDSITRLTGSVDTSGTIVYMAPEQILGKYDYRSDIYSLGVTLYEMLTGEVPFRGGDVYIQKKEMAYTEASEADRSIPRKIDTIIAKCLQVDPDKRYTSCLELYYSLKYIYESMDLI